MTKLYVGNLPWTATEDEIRQMFESIGPVNSINVITDRETGRPRGFCFVEMSSADANNAISQLNGKDFGGRTLRVNEAQERAPRGPSGPRRSGGGDGGKRW
jgi:RNA recognition motif-containing protein